MVRDVEKRNEDENENLPANERTNNYYESYGAQASQRNIVGTLLRFNKGDYTYGQNDDLMDEGTQMIVDMGTLLVGWQKWQDNKPADSEMGPVNEGFQPPRRKELGDLEDTEWEVDETSGKPRDPWQFTNLVVMRQMGTKGDDEGLFTFATSSRGGINAVGALCKTYGKKIRENPNAYPIVELNVDSYMHSNKQFGRIKIPVLDVVGWAAADDVNDATETQIEAVDQETGEVTETRTKTAPKRIAAAKKPAATKKAEPPKGKKKARF